MVVNGEPVPLLGPAEIHRRRIIAARWLEWACRGDDGVDESDDRYQVVTEGRDVGAMQKRYSSCADLAHWVYFRVGCREKWINREEHNGWRVAVNVSRIVHPARSALWKPGVELLAGDVIVVANDWPRGKDAHVICVIARDSDRLYTAEYGQPGGALKAYKAGPLHAWLGGRKIRTHMSMAERLENAARTGLLAPAEEPPRE